MVKFTRLMNAALNTAYLVVGHNVHSAMCGERWQVTQVQGLIDNPLAAECSISMQQDAHHLQTGTSYTSLLNFTCNYIPDNLFVIGIKGNYGSIMVSIHE